MVSITESMAGRFLRHEPVISYPGLKSKDSMIKGGDLYLALRKVKAAKKPSVRSTLTKGTVSSQSRAGGRS